MFHTLVQRKESKDKKKEEEEKKRNKILCQKSVHYSSLNLKY